MMPISGVNTGAVQSLTTAEKALGASKVQKPEEASQGRQLKPVMDEYVPEEFQEPSGRYWMGTDEDGQPKIYFDDRSRAEDGPEQPEGVPEAEEPDPAGQGAKEKEDKDEVWECNTDQVDREIENLKKKQQELEQRLSAETNEAKIKDLERQLFQVGQELKRKDSDTYRKQNASFTQVS